MHAADLRAIYLGLAGADLVWGLVLSALNYRNVRRHEHQVPAEFRDRVSPEEHAKATRYSLAKMRLGFVSVPVITVVTLAAVVVGLFGFLDRAAGLILPAEYLHGAFFLGLVALLTGLLSLPFSLYSTFVLEKNFGFNTTRFGTWILDLLKSTLISMAIGLPLLMLLFLFMDATGRLWWLWAFAAFSLINLGISLIYPLVIAPLFNTFSPLPEGSLAGKIRELAGRLGFAMSGVFVMDGSKRSRHSNAYFTGLGRMKRIVLYDTLVEQMAEDEILAVLAHEIGHEKKRHVLQGILLSTLLSLIGFWLLSLLRGWAPLYPAFGFGAETKEALFLILSLAAGPCTFVLSPLFSVWSRKHEFQADRYAAEAAGADAMGRALLRLNRENASNLTPHPLYSFWYYSHPSLGERLKAIGFEAAKPLT